MATAAFTFDIPDKPAGVSLEVNHFTGEEGTSQLFRFDIDFDYVTEDATNIPSGLVGKMASLGVGWGSGTPGRTIRGRVVELQMGKRLETTNNQGDTEYSIHCCAALVPWLYLLTKSHRSRVFQVKNVLTIMEEVLTGAGFAKDTDFKIDVVDEKVFDKREYCVQYDESDFHFISRLMEDEGLFYFFDHTSTGEVLVITDKLSTDLETTYASVGTYPYMPNRGGLVAQEDEVWELMCHNKVLTGQVQLLDYNYEDFSQEYPPPGTLEKELEDAKKAYEKAEKDAAAASPPDPALDIAAAQAKSDLDALRRASLEHGQFLKEGRDFIRPETDESKLEGGTDYKKQTDYDDARCGIQGKQVGQVDRIAAIRAEEIGCQREVFNGFSECAGFASGFPFILTGYYASSNPVAGEPFLLTGITHFGGPTGSIPSDVEADIDGNAIPTVYYNAFTCIRQSVPYRAPRGTPMPRVPGVITAQIENHGTDRLIDQEGRYNVRLPFEETAGATKRIRMAQPYSGKDYGIHFPNPEGAEAVLAFIGGDIDRPIMLSTLPNRDHHTPVPNTKHTLTSQNPKLFSLFGQGPFDEEKNVIRTKRGHQLVMDDGDGTANVGITLQTGKSPTKEDYDEGVLTPYRDLYWKSKLELGGYRVKSGFEQVVDIGTQGLGWPTALLRGALGDVPGLAATIWKMIPQAAAIVLAHIATDDCPDEWFGLGPVKSAGASLSTYDQLQLSGKNGVKISCANMPLLYSLIPIGSLKFLGEDKEYDFDVRSYMETIGKFVVNTLWRASLKKVIDDIKKEEARYEKYKKAGATKVGARLAALARYDYDKKHNKLRSVIYNTLQLPGISLDSAGPLKLTAYQNIAVLAGQGGYSLESFGDISQKADLDASLVANQKISIKTRGTPYELGEANPLYVLLKKGVKKLGEKFPILKPLEWVTSWYNDTINKWFVGKYTGMPKTFPIEITNENGDIRLKTEGKAIKKHPEERGNIELHANEGHIKAYAQQGHVRLWSKTSSVYLGEELGLELESDKEINLQCGESQILLKPDGEISIAGTKISINGKAITLKGSDELTLAVAPTLWPKQPDPVEYKEVSSPEAPEVVKPSKEFANDPELLKVCAEINKLNAEIYALDLEAYTKYQVYLQQKEAHKALMDQFVKSQPMASIELKALPGDIAVQCTNYAAESKLKYEYKGLLINGEATGLHSTKGALAKVN